MSSPEGRYNTLMNERSPVLHKERTGQLVAPNVHYSSTAGPEGTYSEYHEHDDDETPQDSGVMIHVAPEPSIARWTHISDLDSFFSRMYCYHQRHGFQVMALGELLGLAQFVFVVLFTTFLLHCVNYPILFRDKDPPVNRTKVTLGDAVLPAAQCIAGLGGVAWAGLGLAALFWALRLVTVLYHLAHYWDIKKFFNIALKIDDSDLDNLTWHEVQRRVREVQGEQQMCIHKAQLTELDIYHRILRFKNYMVAMVNKSLLPVRFQVPLVGEVVYLSRGLRYNMELLLFWGPWSPFENNWHLREDFKRAAKRNELAQELSRHIFYVALANLLLCPLVLLWQLMFLFFSYGEMIKREPGTLGSRGWSQYARLYLRHFNELDHELNARLTRAYRPAARYMAAFSSPFMAVIARNIAFVSGGILVTLLILTVYDEDVLAVEHVLSIMTVLGAVVAACRVFIPDENLVWCPEQLLAGVLAHVHYLPSTWRGLAHTSAVRDQFSTLFQYRAVYLVCELLSPLATPFILLWWLRPRALDIVDFYRNFTVAVIGVGDVCSFAQMDIRKHGHPDWQATQSGPEDLDDDDTETQVCPNQYTQGEHGKTELSLLHFALTNPEWRMPRGAERFVRGLRKGALDELRGGIGNGMPTMGAMGHSLNTLSSLGGEYTSIVNSILLSNNILPALGGHNNLFTSDMNIGGLSHISEGPGALPRSTGADSGSSMTGSVLIRGLNRAEGPAGYNNGLLFSLHGDRGSGASLGASFFGQGTIGLPRGPMTNTGVVPEYTAADMSLSTLYLHEIHHRQIKRRGHLTEQSQRYLWQRPHMESSGPSPQPAGVAQSGVAGVASGDAERTPLLTQKKL